MLPHSTTKTLKSLAFHHCRLRLRWNSRLVSTTSATTNASSSFNRAVTIDQRYSRWVEVVEVVEVVVAVLGGSVALGLSHQGCC